MNNQYIERYMRKNLDSGSYEMVAPSDYEEQEPVNGLDKTGVLLLKNIIDKIEYHLYDKSKPESIDINATLDIHLYNVIKKPIQLAIKCENGFYFNIRGKLMKKTVNKIDKYYFEGNEYIDIEKILFDNTEQTTNIKINTVHKEEANEVQEGENKVDGLQEN
jgi:hypothetical protein